MVWLQFDSLLDFGDMTWQKSRKCVFAFSKKYSKINKTYFLDKNTYQKRIDQCDSNKSFMCFGSVTAIISHQMNVENFWFQLFRQSKSDIFMILQNHRNLLDGAMFEKSKVVCKKELGIKQSIWSVVSICVNTMQEINHSQAIVFVRYDVF